MPSPSSWRTALLWAMAVSALPSGASAQSRPRLAVLDFENQTTAWPGQLGSAVASLLATRLVQASEYSVIERTQLDAILEEQGLQMSGVVTPEQAVRIGRVAGVDYVVLGAVSRFTIDTRRVGFGGLGAEVTEAESALNARLVDTETAEIVAAAEAAGKKRLVSGSLRDMSFASSATLTLDVAQEAIEPALDQLVERLGEQRHRLKASGKLDLSPATVVGLNADGRVYVNRGENAGVQVGQRFAVVRVVDEIVDADGTVLDVVTDRVAVLEVVRVLGRSSICRLIDGEPPQEGDTVEALGGVLQEEGP